MIICWFNLFEILRLKTTSVHADQEALCETSGRIFFFRSKIVKQTDLKYKCSLCWYHKVVKALQPRKSSSVDFAYGYKIRAQRGSFSDIEFE